MSTIADLLTTRPDGGEDRPIDLQREAGVAYPSALAWARGTSIPDPLRRSQAGLDLVRQRIGARVLPGLLTAGYTLAGLAEIGAVVVALRGAATPSRKKEEEGGKK